MLFIFVSSYVGVFSLSSVSLHTHTLSFLGFHFLLSVLLKFLLFCLVLHFFDCYSCLGEISSTEVFLLVFLSGFCGLLGFLQTFGVSVFVYKLFCDATFLCWGEKSESEYVLLLLGLPFFTTLAGDFSVNSYCKFLSHLISSDKDSLKL